MTTQLNTSRMRTYATAVTPEGAEYTPVKFLMGRYYGDRIIDTRTVAEKRAAPRETYATLTRKMREQGLIQ